MATHFSNHTWRIPWTGEPERRQPIGSHRVRHDQIDLAQHTKQKRRDVGWFPPTKYTNTFAVNMCVLGGKWDKERFLKHPNTSGQILPKKWAQVKLRFYYQVSYKNLFFFRVLLAIITANESVDLYQWNLWLHVSPTHLHTTSSFTPVLPLPPGSLHSN